MKKKYNPLWLFYGTILSVVPTFITIIEGIKNGNNELMIRFLMFSIGMLILYTATEDMR